LPDTFPALKGEHLHEINLDALRPASSTHKPRILILYGSLREVSYSRLLAFEAGLLLERFGCEVRIFDPKGLPLPDEAPVSHPKVQELRELSLWSEGQLWVSPERHGAMTGIMKSQIDWIPLSCRIGPPDTGQDARRDGGFRGQPVIQCREPDAHSRTMDADDHHSQPVIGGQSLSGIRC
jgi:arsenical resistance protein ArsH